MNSDAQLQAVGKQVITVPAVDTAKRPDRDDTQWPFPQLRPGPRPSHGLNPAMWAFHNAATFRSWPVRAAIGSPHNMFLREKFSASIAMIGAPEAGVSSHTGPLISTVRTGEPNLEVPLYALAGMAASTINSKRRRSVRLQLLHKFALVSEAKKPLNSGERSPKLCSGLRRSRPARC